MTTDEFPTYAFISGLFGPRSPAVPIFGSSEALEHLREAVELRSLHIQKLCATDAVDVLTPATMHLKAGMEFPIGIDIADYFKTTELEVAALGIDTARIWTESEALFTRTDRLNLDRTMVIQVLSYLQAAERYYSSEADWQNLSERFHYELGIVLMTHAFADAPTLEVQIFRDRAADAAKTRTIWVFCRRNWDYNLGFTESWHSIGRALWWPDEGPTAVPFQQPLSLQPVDAQISQQSVPPTSHEKSTMNRRKRKRVVNADDLVGSAFPRVSPAQRLKEQREAIDLDNTSPAEILAGEPDLVRQGVLIHVAKFYTNTEIFNALNESLVARGRAPIKSPNNITKLLSLAIESAAAKDPGATKDDLRRQLNAARRANGVGKGANTQSSHSRETTWASAGSDDCLDQTFGL